MMQRDNVIDKYIVKKSKKEITKSLVKGKNDS